MASSKVSSMIVFLLLVLIVFPHMDEARKLSGSGVEETKDHDHFTNQKAFPNLGLSPGVIGPKICKLLKCFGSPPTQMHSKGTQGSGH